MKTLFNKLVALLIIMVTALSSTSVSAETITYYHLDALDSPVAASDESGNILWREEYAPYGDRIRVENPTNTHGFTGKFHEEDLGLTYFGAHCYDPVAGRFMGIDPVEYREGDIHSFNRYAYANNNPYKFVDPDGRQSVLNYFRRDLSPIEAMHITEVKAGAAAVAGVGGAAMALSATPAGRVILEEIAAEATGVPIPSKKQVVDLIKRQGIGFTRSQLQHAFKHAKDFGISGNANNKTLAEFSSAIDLHVTGAGTQAIQGTYRGQTRYPLF